MRLSPQQRALVGIWVVGLSAATLLLWLTRRHGLAFTNDGFNYYAASITGRMATGEPFVAWPPLVPAALYAVGLGGLRWLHAVALCVTCVLTGRWVLASTHRPALAVLASAFAGFHPWMLYVHHFVFSEPLFVLWTMACLTATRASLAGVWLSLATMTRYVGIALVPAALWKRQGTHALVAVSLGLVPLTAWLLRNVLVSGTTTGVRYAPSATLWSLVSSTGASFGSQILPHSLALLTPWLWLVVVLGISLCSRTNMGAYVASYLAFYLAMAASSPVDDPGPRLLAPVLPPFFAACAKLYASVSRPAMRAGLMACAASAILFSSVHNVQLLRHVRPAMPSVPNLSSVRLPVVSNAPGLVFLGAQRTAMWSPRLTYYHSTRQAIGDDIRRITTLIDRHGAVALVWFVGRRQPHLLPLEQYGAHFDVVPSGLSTAECRIMLLHRPSSVVH